MSTFADPADSALWEDGDAFRAAAGTSLPSNIFAASLTGWEPLGGVKAGFTVTPSQDRTTLSIWNKLGPYRIKKGDRTDTIKFRPVDYSKGTALTLLQGGTIAETGVGSSIFEWTEGSDPFALIIRVQDGAKWKGYYIAKCELSALPEEALNDDDLDGWDLEIIALDNGDGKPIRKFTSFNPIA